MTSPVSSEGAQKRSTVGTVFAGNFTTTKDLEQGVQATAGTTNSFDLQQFGRQKRYGLDFEGYLRVSEDGFYEFAVESDDGAVLQIDDEVVVDNDGNHGTRLVAGHIYPPGIS